MKLSKKGNLIQQQCGNFGIFGHAQRPLNQSSLPMHLALTCNLYHLAAL